MTPGDREITAKLENLGHTQIEPNTFYLQLADDLEWLIEYDYRSYMFSEWSGDIMEWCALADFYSGDAMVTVLEAIGART